MKTYDLLALANKNLWRRKGRTVLTVMGVVIGTASIVVMMSLGIGLVETAKEDLARWGSLNIVRVQQGWSHPDDPEGEQQRRLTDDAIEEIRAMPGVVAVTPVFEVSGEASWGRKQGYIQLAGIEPAMMEQLEFKLQGGRLLETTDRFNVVAGSQVINNFWDEAMMRPGRYSETEQQDPLDLLNQRLKMTVYNGKGQKRIYNLHVVGVLSEENMDFSWQVFGPINEIKKIRDFMQQGQQGGEYGYSGVIIRGGMGSVMIAEDKPSPSSSSRQKKEEEQYNYAIVAAADVSEARRLSMELREMGFNAWSMADSLEGIEDMAKRFQAILGGIGGITLLVAAIGITNTMVMSIYERTREIAISKVIGASFADIRGLFLAESSLIGLLGGAFGLGLSYLLSYALNRYGAAAMYGGMAVPDATVTISMIPPWLALFALLFAMSIGLVAGLYPANRAIKLDPITAMRHY